MSVAFWLWWSTLADMNESAKREQAWIGDAVLALYAREWILRQTSILAEQRAEVFVQMTSNKFLSALGEPGDGGRDRHGLCERRA